MNSYLRQKHTINTVTMGFYEPLKKSTSRIQVLPKLIEQYKALGLPLDTKFYVLLLKHSSCYCYSTIRNFNEEIVEAAFILLCELICEYKASENVKLPYLLKLTEKAFLNKDIELWKLASCYQ